MKRPMLFCGSVSLLLSVIATELSSTALMHIIAVCAILVLAILLHGWKDFLFLIPAFLVIALVAGCCIPAVFTAKRAYSLSGECELDGIICDIEQGNYAKYVLKTDTVDGEPLKIKVRLISLTPENYETGDRLRVKTELFDADEPQAQDLSQGVYRTAYLGEVIEHEKSDNLYGLLAYVRGRLSGIIMDRLSYDDASFITALSIGDGSFISSELKENIRRAGVSHTVVVS